MESSYFYLGLDICLPKGVGLYTCPSEVAALKQYIKLFCWCVRFLQLSLQVRGADIYPPDLCTEKRCSPTDLRSGQAANQMPNCTMVSPAPRAIVAARCYLMRCCSASSGARTTSSPAPPGALRNAHPFLSLHFSPRPIPTHSVNE